MTKILLVRHAYTGVVDKDQVPETDLNQEGIFQAQRLAERLKDSGVNYLYSSPHQRALSTAWIIGRKNGLEFKVEDGLAEVPLWLDIQDLRDDTSAEFQQGLRTLQEAMLRVEGLMGRLTLRHEGETVALVCHGNLIRVILGFTLKMNLSTLVRLKVDHTSVTTLVWVKTASGESFFRLEGFNNLCYFSFI